jgi:DNA-binding MarR family transcriptional regulator
VDLSAFQKLDPVIHEKARLRIMAALAPADSLTFKELRDLLEMTDGNLSVHMRTLEENRYVRVKKDFVDRRPRTTYALSAEGRRAFATYIEALEEIIRQSRAPQAVASSMRSGTAVPAAGRRQPSPATK